MDHSHDKVVWLEGMFLSPQHFQQQERYIERYGQRLFQLLADCQAGFTSLLIDTEQLKAGKLYIRRASGLFGDGTPFDLSSNICRNIDSSHAGSIAYLAIPMTRGGLADTAAREQISQSIRYQSYERLVRDSTNNENDPVNLELADLNPCLLLENESLDDYTTLAVARIQEFRSDGELVLDSSFIPRCLDYRVSRYLEEQVQNIQALMQQRASLIAAQIGVEGEKKSFQTMQSAYMWLQALNRYAAELKQLQQQRNITAGDLYRRLTVMAADLATFTTTLAPDFPLFNEQNIYGSFAPVIACLLLNLRQASSEKVVTLHWDRSLFKLRRLLRTQVEDRTLFNDGRFILAVSCSLGTTETRSAFISAAKCCGHNRIAEKVRNALSAVPINALATAPIELKPRTNTVYFEIDTSNDLWLEMVKTRDLLALHIDEQMPDDTSIDCYVIR